MRYKVGDRVRIVKDSPTMLENKKPCLGREMTIAMVNTVGKCYRMVEDNWESPWFNEDIEGLASDPLPPQEVTQEESGDQFRPDYYGGADNTYEVRKFINAHNLNFNIGNIVKYAVRAGKKEDNSVVSDLNKILKYVQFELERISE